MAILFIYFLHYFYMNTHRLYYFTTSYNLEQSTKAKNNLLEHSKV